MEKNLHNNDDDDDDRHRTILKTNHKRKQDFDDESEEIQSKGFRSQSTSLPFGIANVLQSNSESTKISPISLPTSLSSPINPWLMAIHHLSQSSSSTAALANASNWCAKCSIQFRLTSELVHHIRVHHATRRHYHHQLSNEFPTRKILNNSSSTMTLTCQICYETFRERHHLTRHMTSHR